MSERDILTKLNQAKTKCVKFMDFIEEKNASYVIIEQPQGQNLRDSILNLGLT